MRRTRISAHMFSNISGVLTEGDNITISGKIMYYDDFEKTWKPVGGVLKVLLNGKEIRLIKSDDGDFRFSIKAPPEGKHKLEIRFLGDELHEPNFKVLNFQVLSKEHKRTLMKFLNIAYLFAGIVYLALLITLILMILMI